MQKFEDLTLEEKQLEQGEKRNFEFTVEEYKVLSKIDTREFKICFPKEIIDFISQDENFFTGTEMKDQIADREKLTKILFSSEDKVIDLSSNPFITDKIILKALFALLGSVNGTNDATQITSDDLVAEIEDESCIENFGSKTYSSYVEQNIPLIFSQFKIKDLEPLVKSLKWMGLEIFNSKIYSGIKNFNMSRNKILLTMTPSNNFWIKSEKPTIGTKNYDKRINNYSMIFYNWPLIKTFYDRVANHPRCAVGFLNSMVKKNLQPCIEAIPIEVKNFTKYVMFDQDSHENLNSGDTKAKPNFVRNLGRMKNVLKSYENSNFNETNILILESEKDKMSETSKENSIMMNVFSEEYLTYNQHELEEFKAKSDKIFDYLEKLLNECEGDVREYIVQNPLN